MIRIAIVEDDTGYRSQLGKYIDQYQSDFSETVSVSEFSDGLEIVEKYKSEYDIILMDIQMKHMDGMQAAMRIRDMDKNVIIIFITNSAQFAVQGYKVEALDYVLKPIQYFAFSQVLHNAVKKVHGKSKFYIHLMQESKMIRLDCKFYKLHLGRNSCAICAGFYLQYWYNSIERRRFHGNLLFRQQGHFPNQRLRRRLLSSTGIT